MNTFSITQPKIRPWTQRPLRPDGTPDDNDRVETGPTPQAFALWQSLGLQAPALSRLREQRLARLVGQLQAHDCPAIVLFDPLNIRYATDTTNMQVWCLHNPTRACVVTADGYMVLWDFHGCDHLSAHLPLVRELRHGASFFYFESGDRTEEHARRFAQEVSDLVRERMGHDCGRIAVDRMEFAGIQALQSLGWQLQEGQRITELARAVKGEEEIRAMRCAVASCEEAMRHMQAALRPGLTECDVWSILHAENIRHGGEWIETRILSSGPRTNPWFQECGPRVLQEGELLAFDTDLVGVYGMCCDISRTWLIGEGEPTAEQQQLFDDALSHIRENMSLLRPGRSFLELSRIGQKLPEKYRAQRYGVMYHGVGLCDEYPSIRYPEDVEECGYDGILEPGMVLCVEVYCGEVGAKEGVKLEEQVLITEDGHECLSRYPLRLMP